MLGRRVKDTTKRWRTPAEMGRPECVTLPPNKIACGVQATTFSQRFIKRNLWRAAHRPHFWLEEQLMRHLLAVSLGMLVHGMVRDVPAGGRRALS